MATEKRERQRANREKRRAQEAAAAGNANSQLPMFAALGVGALVILGAIFFLTRDDDGDESVSIGSTIDAFSDAPVVTEAPIATEAPGEPGEPAWNVGSSVECPPVDGSAEPRQEFPEAPPQCIDPTKTYSAEVVTNKGTVVIELDAAQAPLTVNNFVTLARYRYYEDVVFHRLIEGFMVQGGDPTGTGAGGPGYQFPDELQGGTGPFYEKGSVAMANAGPNTNGSQFFIVTGASGENLPDLYSRFGTVSEGFEVVQAIEAAASGDAAGTPVEDIIISTVTITES